jgi:hypothetical protein
MLQWEIVGVDTVVRLQEPTAAAPREVVSRIAGGALHRLQKRRLRVQPHELAKCSAGRRFPDERRNGERGHWTVRHLLECPPTTCSISKEDADAKHALATDRRDLDERAVAHPSRN